MSRHTPGPWLFRAKSDSVYTAPPAGTEYTYGSHIFGFQDEACPSDADLSLILAAPDLLEVLEGVERLCSSSGYVGVNGQYLKVVRAAIAKAKGESA